jgi:hypothetical protein
MASLLDPVPSPRSNISSTDIPEPGNHAADDDHLYVCLACGKTSTTCYGFDAANKSTASPGWDESCMMNAVLLPKARLQWNTRRTRVVSMTPEAP